MRQKSPVLTLTVALAAAFAGCTDSSPEQIHSPFSGVDGGGSYAPPSQNGDLSGISGISGHDDDAGEQMAEDASVPEHDASVITPEHDAGHPPPVDASIAYDCYEDFTWDPGSRTDVQTVVIASGFLSNWNPALSPALHLDADGKWRIHVGMYRTVMAYKFVINGTEWIPDPSECHQENDGFNGHNSVRYACQEAPACPDAGTPPVEDAGTDASVTSDASTPALDAGGAVTDAGSATDAGSGMDATTGADAGTSDAGGQHDAGTPPDFAPGSSYLEVFEVDPKDYPHLTISSVELRGAAPFSWTAGRKLHADADGVFRYRVLMDAGEVEYKFRFNDSDELWDVDREYCTTSAGGNSLRTPGKAANACCKNVTVHFAATGCAALTSVELSGDLTAAWKTRAALSADAAGGGYSLTFPSLVPGDYGYKIVINGSTYLPVDDDNCQDNSEANSVLHCVP